MGRRPKYRCSDCEHWKPGEEWHSTMLPYFHVIAEGTCLASGKPKLNCNYRCFGDFKLKDARGFIIVGNEVSIRR